MLTITLPQVLPLKKMGINHIMDLPKVMPDVIKQERNAQVKSATPR